MCFRPAEIQMNKCPECGKINKPIAKVCEECGAELNTGPKAITCPICGTQNPATATTCVNCGATEAEIMEAMAKDGAGAPGAPKPPGAPGAPKPPGAPTPPKAPGAPKPPA